MLRLNMSLQGAVISKLLVARITVVGGALVLCKFVSPQVALVCEGRRALVTLPFFLENETLQRHGSMMMVQAM